MTSQPDYDPYATNTIPNAQNHVRIGNYELVRCLGRGAMGEVYLARHARLGDRLYALKTILQTDNDADSIFRFEREITALAKLAHPNLLYAVDAGEHEGKLYLVTEYIDGIDLSKLVRRVSHLSLANACEIVRQMSLGLAVAHDSKIVHRDIKPSNTMLDRNGDVKILDLGLALIEDHNKQQLTGQRTALGTPEYMSPEQWNGSHSVTAASDIYSLGCTLHFLIAGRPPFPASSYKSLPAIMQAHLQKEPDDIRNILPDVPPNVADLILRCLAKESPDRPRSCSEIAEALTPFCAGADLRKIAAEVIPAEGERSNLSTEAIRTTQDENPIASNQSSGKEENWSRFDARFADWNWPLAIITVVVLLLSLVSLSMAYFGPSTTETWTRRFDRLQDRAVPAGTGFLVEAIRAVLFIVSTALVCMVRFNEPLKRFFSLRLNAGSIWGARIFLMIVVGFFARLEIPRHWIPSEAGADMVKWSEVHGIEHTTAEKEIVAYRWYLPYSLSLYIFVFCGLIACPLLQFLLSDYRYLNQRLELLRAKLKEVRGSKEQIKQLHQFGRGCLGLTSRYVDAIGVLAGGIQYDFWIGRYTMSDQGRATEILAMISIASMVALFFVICHSYTRAIELTTHALSATGFEEEQALSQIGLIWFLKSSITNRLSGIACLSLVVVALASFFRAG